MSRYDALGRDQLRRLVEIEHERAALLRERDRSMAQWRQVPIAHLRRLMNERRRILGLAEVKEMLPQYEIPIADSDLWECGSNGYERSVRAICLRNGGPQ